MNITTCPNCGMKVLPNKDNTCPSCHKIIPVGRRSSHQSPSTRREHTQETANSKLIITRGADFIDISRSYSIIVDGTPVGQIRRGQTVSFRLTPGSHSIHLSIDWCRSNLLNFDTVGEEEVSLVCGSNLTGGRILLALLYITIWWDRYLWIRRSQSSAESQ